MRPDDSSTQQASQQAVQQASNAAATLAPSSSKMRGDPGCRFRKYGERFVNLKDVDARFFRL